MDCADCHDTNNYPLFGDPNAAEILHQTHVCDTCHSEGGSYNGIDDTGDSIGAKKHWDDVYNADGDTLLVGKEKWCVGCHDEGTSNINGVNAPDIKLYYTSGHGRSGVNRECLDCHVTSEIHIDQDARTYAFNSSYYDSSQSGVNYSKGYRLGYVNGEVPLMIPADYNITFENNYKTMKNNAFRLCFTSFCHANDFNKIFDNTYEDGIQSNFKASLPNPPRNNSYAWGINKDRNEHYFHIISLPGTFADSDWDINTNSSNGQNGKDTLIACFTCHNVHGASGANGSTNEVMIRDGILVGRDGYAFSYLIENINAGGYPMVTSMGANQSNSIGAIFRNNTSDNMCGGSICHGNPTPPVGSSYDSIGSGLDSYLEYYRPWMNY